MSNQASTQLLRGAEVAEMIGCSRAMAYRLMQRGTIPVVRIPGGKTVRVPRESLLQWIKVNTRAGFEATGIETNTAQPAESERRPNPTARQRRGNIHLAKAERIGRESGAQAR